MSGQEEFARGTLVLVTLNAPREKFWGALLTITPAGATLRGLALHSLDDFAEQVREDDSIVPNTVFFPMHRVERMEIDARTGDIPALYEKLEARTGRTAQSLLKLEHSAYHARQSRSHQTS